MTELRPAGCCSLHKSPFRAQPARLPYQLRIRVMLRYRDVVAALTLLQYRGGQGDKEARLVGAQCRLEDCLLALSDVEAPARAGKHYPRRWTKEQEA